MHIPFNMHSVTLRYFFEQILIMICARIIFVKLYHNIEYYFCYVTIYKYFMTIFAKTYYGNTKQDFGNYNLFINHSIFDYDPKSKKTK